MSSFERVYYQLKIKLASPLSVGSGESENTDHDVFVDGNGNPVIPATSIAGVLRAFVGGDTAVELFGEIAKKDGEQTIPSHIRVYDALCTKGDKDYITNRDFVKLKDKVAVKGAKFDYQVVETGAEFVSYCELLDCSYEAVLEAVLPDRKRNRRPFTGRNVPGTEAGRGSENKENSSSDQQSGKEENAAQKIKRLYRKIVKRLHPDVCPNPTEHEKDLLNRAMKAFEEGDLDQLERIWDELSGTDAAHEVYEDTAEGREKLKEYKRLEGKDAKGVEQYGF